MAKSFSSNIFLHSSTSFLSKSFFILAVNSELIRWNESYSFFKFLRR